MTAIGCASANAAADEVLKLGFAIRPGMAELVDGVPTGTYLPVAADIVRTAHLQVQWQDLPQSRLIAEVRANIPDYCAVGIYETAERAAYAKFSHGFFLDKPMQIITLKSKEAQIREHANFAALAADTRLKVGLVDGYSYGTRLDHIISAMPNADRMSGTTVQDMAKLLAGRFDYILGPGEEAQRDASVIAPAKHDIVSIAFPDLAPGEMRHFMCSTAVSDATLARLNTAIHALHLDAEPKEH
jgi:polar amino acid transport system substrate-binding protein